MGSLNRFFEPRGLSLPAPIVIPASQDFDGNDGPWSSFALRVGTPAQTVKVMISTAGSQTWVVLPEGCTSLDPPDCLTSRGGEFYTNRSSTWRKNNVTSNGIFSLGLESNLGSIGNNGKFGYDTVRLGWQGSGGPSLDHQILAGIVTKQFFLGVFGLNPRPTNFSNFSDPSPSYMSNLKDKSLIPSLSWSYTAGNQYRLNKVLGTLTLGGYDSSKFVSNNVSFAFSEIDSRDLTVVNKRLKAQNATVVFELGNWETDKTVNISLPYAAFDLIAEYPLMPNRTRYFPLVRATNDTQYTLGRAFLQEA